MTQQIILSVTAGFVTFCLVMAIAFATDWWE